MALQSSTTATPRAFACKSLVGKAASFPPSLVNFSFRSSYSPRSLTSVADNLRLLDAKSGRGASLRCFASALTPQLKSTIDKVVTSNKVVLFMKGTKDFPQCGFSHTVVQILKSLNVPFESINILENELLRQGLKEYSSWPTFPQLYIEGEFFGGCDITIEAYKSGELQELLEKAMCS
ncbi:Monothiol glutaredoxin-related [Melia azedarach]|uniref:Monothiol glutaredoxin-related n=1 Tax=Melia azedarach TaxID=155640 RepID=A0ACC1Z1L4_MELAZ|nr:Monothiol glutaredoxin-related [Melia azedarach]